MWEIQPLFNKINIENQKYSNNYHTDNIKQCDRLIKKLKNDFNYKLKIDKLCKKYNINDKFKKIIDNNLLSEQPNNLTILKQYKNQLKKNKSQIRTNKWSIFWRKFFCKKIGIFKNTFQKEINSYIENNQELSEKNKSY